MGHIKLWDSLLDDPKTHRLSDRAFRVWIKVLLSALRNGGRNGELPTRETLEFLLRMSWADIEPSIDELVRSRLLDQCPDNPIGGSPWKIHDWDHWQTSRDSKGAERQRRWRERQASRIASRNGVTSNSGDAVEGKKEEGKNTPLLNPPVPVTATVTEATAKPKKAAFILPDWIPPREWEGFVAMRKQIKKPLTDLAMEQAVRKLDELRKAGDDPAAVLEQSIFHCWQRLLPLSAGSDAPFADRQPTKPTPTVRPEDRVHVAPADSPFREIERQRRAKLFAFFGGQGEQGGPAAPAEPGSGEVGPGLVSAG